MLRFRIRIRIRRIRIFLVAGSRFGDPLVRFMNPDPSIHKQKKSEKPWFLLFCDFFLTYYLWKWCKCSFSACSHKRELRRVSQLVDHVWSCSRPPTLSRTNRQALWIRQCWESGSVCPFVTSTNQDPAPAPDPFIIMQKKGKPWFLPFCDFFITFTSVPDPDP